MSKIKTVKLAINKIREKTGQEVGKLSDRIYILENTFPLTKDQLFRYANNLNR